MKCGNEFFSSGSWFWASQFLRRSFLFSALLSGLFLFLAPLPVSSEEKELTREQITERVLQMMPEERTTALIDFGILNEQRKKIDAQLKAQIEQLKKDWTNSKENWDKERESLIAVAKFSDSLRTAAEEQSRKNKRSASSWRTGAIIATGALFGGMISNTPKWYAVGSLSGLAIGSGWYIYDLFQD